MRTWRAPIFAGRLLGSAGALDAGVALAVGGGAGAAAGAASVLAVVSGARTGKGAVDPHAARIRRDVVLRALIS
jgi:hypothetical protein